MTVSAGKASPPVALDPEALDMLRRHLQPRVEQGQPEDNQHAFILVGDRTLFLCHMTMFHMEEHCHQLVLRVRVPERLHEQIRQWRRERPDEPMFMATPAGIDIADLVIGKTPLLRMALYRGIPAPNEKGEYLSWPWKDRAQDIADVPVEMARVVLHRHFHLGFPPPPSLTYFLFGAGDEAHMQSYQFAEPDFDHVVSLEAAPPWLPANKLEAGAIVSFPAIDRVPLPLSNRLQPGTHQADYHGFSSYLGNPIAPTFPLQVGRTWWWSLSPLNLVMPGQASGPHHHHHHDAQGTGHGG